MVTSLKCPFCINGLFDFLPLRFGTLQVKKDFNLWGLRSTEEQIAVC